MGFRLFGRTCGFYDKAKWHRLVDQPLVTHQRHIQTRVRAWSLMRNHMKLLLSRPLFGSALDMETRPAISAPNVASPVKTTSMKKRELSDMAELVEGRH